MPKRNTCSEETIQKAFQLVLKQPIQFNYEMSTNDDQIDIGPVFMRFGGTSQLWTSGASEASLLADFSNLDENKSYFMRSGQGGGAGHYQLLSFDENEQGWRGFSSQTNQWLFTRDGAMTDEGRASLMTRGATAIWGPEQGQYSILIQEATPERVIAAANFVHDYRMQPSEMSAIQRENSAIERLYSIQDRPELNTMDGYIRAVAVNVDSEPEMMNVNEKLDAAKAYFLLSTSRSGGLTTSEIQTSTKMLIDALNECVAVDPSHASHLLMEMDSFLAFHDQQEPRSTQTVVEESISKVQLRVKELSVAMEATERCKLTTREFKSRLEPSFMQSFERAKQNFASSAITEFDLDENRGILEAAFVDLFNHVEPSERSRICQEMKTYLNGITQDSSAAKNSCVSLIRLVENMDRKLPPTPGCSIS